MQVIDHLSGPLAAVHEQPVTAVGDTFLFSQTFGHLQ